MSRPFQFTMHSTYFSCTAMVIHFFILIFYLHSDFVTAAFITASIFFSEAITTVIIYIFAENLCSRKVNELMKEEIDKDIINRDKFYGLNLYLRIFFHIIMPSIMSTLILIFFIGKDDKSTVITPTSKTENGYKVELSRFTGEEKQKWVISDKRLKNIGSNCYLTGGTPIGCRESGINYNITNKNIYTTLGVTGSTPKALTNSMTFGTNVAQTNKGIIQRFRLVKIY